MKDDLEKRMKEAGMLSISEMLDNNPLGKFSVHAGVKDLKTFEKWLKMRHEEMLRMKIRMILDKKEDDDLFEWVLSHEAVFNEVRCNLREAKKETELFEEFEKEEPEYQYTYDGEHSHYDDELVVGGESSATKVSNAMSTFAKVIVIVCIIYAIVEWWLG